ncbi:MAG: glycosyltransferase family 87 protein [Corynebacterium sp.]|nr:glycosyltransferase family 87 protein [Corynebacterium sp.]
MASYFKKLTPLQRCLWAFLSIAFIGYLVMLFNYMSFIILPDLDAFHNGVDLWIHGQRFYYTVAELEELKHYLYIYPPFSLPFFIPLLLLQGETSRFFIQVAASFATFIAVWVMMWACAKQYRRPFPRGTAILLGLIAIWFEPIQSTIGLGQVDAVIWCFPIVDILCLRNTRWRGLGIAFAAGFKLTPIVMLIIYLARKDWRACLNAIGGFILALLLGFLWAPKSSVYFWSEYIFGTTTKMHAQNEYNQSIGGMLYRLGMSVEEARHIALILLPIVLVLCYFACRRLLHSKLYVEACFLLIVAPHFAFPASSTHHFAAIVIGLPVLCYSANRAIRIIAGISCLINLGLAAIYYPFLLSIQYHPTNPIQANLQAIGLGICTVLFFIAAFIPRRVIPERRAEISSQITL